MNSVVVERLKYSELHKNEIFDKANNIVNFGIYNSTPEIVKTLYANSPTTTLCVDTLASYLAGNYFDEAINNFEIGKNNWYPITAKELLIDICNEIAKFNGVYIHFQYNGAFEKIGARILPFENCRVSQKDNESVPNAIIYSDLGFNKIKKDNFKKYRPYTNNVDILSRYADNAGGFSKFSGTVLFFKMNNKYSNYPVSPVDLCNSASMIEMQLSKFYLSKIDNAFESNYIIKADQSIYGNDEEFQKLQDNLKAIRGIENSNKTLILLDDMRGGADNEKIKFQKIESDDKVEKYEYLSNYASNMIRKTFKIPQQLIDLIPGKLGNTGGEDLIKASALYNSLLTNSRAKIEVLINEVFKNFQNFTFENVKINEYKLNIDIEDETSPKMGF